MTSVKECILLDNHRLELYWDGDVHGSDIAENVSIAIRGKQKRLHTWDEPEEWDKGCLYEAEKRKTTLYITECIYPSDVDAITVSFSDGVTGQDGRPVKKDMACAPVYSPYYEKYTTSLCGIVIKSKAGIADETHKYAAAAADHMLSRIPDVADVMRRFHAEVAIYGLDEDAYAIPEHRIGYKVLRRHVEGFGGITDLPVTSISQSNLLRILEGPHMTRYPNEFIFAHEFGHAIHLIGISYLNDQRRAKKFLQIYENACRLGRWPKTYAINNYEEYFATLTTIWFNVMAESADGSWDGVRGPVNKRKELKEYDPEAYEFFASIYPEEDFSGAWAKTPNFFDPDGTRREKGEKTK